MHARYSKFLNSKPKIYGIEILDIYLVFLTWVVVSLFSDNDLLKIGFPALVGTLIVYYKNSFRPHYIYFVLRKRKYTKIIIGAGNERK